MGSEDFTADKGEWSDSNKGDDKLLDRIRKRFNYTVHAWKEIRDQAELDQRALSTTGCWTDDEIAERKDKRPCIHLDQLTQHVNNLVNNIRSNPIAIKVEPAGEGSDEKTAELRAKRIRAIEYESNAMSAYQTAFESAACMSFGAFGITIEYKAWDSMQRIIKFRRFGNAHAVLWDPDALEADGSDMKDAFVLFRVPRDEFARDYPQAAITSFGEDHQSIAKDWFDDDSVQVAEYWYLEKKSRRMFHLESESGPQRLFSDELMSGWKVKDGFFYFLDGSKQKVLDERTTYEPSVKMVLTNGIEILDKTDWPGKEIPIIPVIGKESYVRVGNKVKRKIYSLIRTARDGQKLFDYYASNEAEVIGMTPKIPYIGYKGQFSEDYWDTIHKEPRAYAEVEPIIDPMTNSPLPLPQRMTYEPPVQALEIGKESARRSIQAAVASYGFTRLDDTNVKSGVALKQIQQQNDLGSYHFVDNYKNAIRRAARIVNDLLDDVESVPMDVSLRNLDETQEVVRINDEEGNKYRLTDEGQHEVTLSTGPNYQSQREEGSEFTDVLVQNLRNLPLDPQMAVKVLAKAIKLKNLGPIGDDLVNILDPQKGQESPEVVIQQMQQQMQQGQQQVQAMNEYAKQIEAKAAELQQKLDSQVLGNETKKEIAALQASVDKFKITADMMIAHEKLSSTENIETAKIGLDEKRMAIDSRKIDIEAEQADVESRIKSMSEENKVKIAENKSKEKKTT